MTAQNALLNDIIRCRPWIESALEYAQGTHDFADIVDAILENRMQLWANDKACAVTEVIDFPKKRMLHVFLAGGDMAGVRDLEEPAIEWGKTIGCTDMTLTGRKGWVRALKDGGWSDSHVMMIKRIS